MMKRNDALCFSLAFLLSACSTWLPSVSFFPENAHVKDTADGLRLVVQQDASRLWESAFLCLKAETDPGEEGLSHLLEHLLIEKLREGAPYFLFEGKSEAHTILLACHFLPEDRDQAIKRMLDLFYGEHRWTPAQLEKNRTLLQFEKRHRPTILYPTQENLPARLSLLQHKFLAPGHSLLSLVTSESPEGLTEKILSLRSVAPQTKPNATNQGIGVAKAISLSPAYLEPIEFVSQQIEETEVFLLLMPGRSWKGLYQHPEAPAEKEINPPRQGFQELARLLGKTESHLPQRVLVLAREGSGDDLAREAKAFLHRQKMQVIEKKELPRKNERVLPEEPALSYVVAGTQAPGLFHKDYFTFYALSVVLSQILYERFIQTGRAYEASAYYDAPNQILGVWVATLPSERAQVTADLQKLLTDAAQNPLARTSWPTLLSRSRLHYCKTHAVVAENFTELGRELAMLCQNDGFSLPSLTQQWQSADFSTTQENFMTMAAKTLQPQKWIFLENSFITKKKE